jgi:hypothetical protein
MRPPEDNVDGIRMRGGLSVGGGLGFLSAGGTTLMAPAGHLTVRLGVQFNHLLSVIYQQMPQLMVITAGGGGAAMFLDYNSLLLNVTLADVFEIGAGPSFDFMAAATLSGLGVGTSSGTGFGVHGRIAAIIGGRAPGTARRSGFSIAADIHPFFFDGGSLLVLGLSVGADWY